MLCEANGGLAYEDLVLKAKLSLGCSCDRIKSEIAALVPHFIKIEKNNVIKTTENVLTGVFKTKSKGLDMYVINPHTNKSISVFDSKGALPGDEVVFCKSIKDDFAEIVLIEKRKKQQVSGVVVCKDGEFLLLPENLNWSQEGLKIDNEQGKEFVGKKVKAGVCFEKGFEVKIEKAYGFANDPIAENVAIAEKYGFEKGFSEKVLQAAEKVQEKISKDERKLLTDLTDLPICTIDPENCKDMDDAIYVKKQKNGNFQIVIAIADVSFYVEQGGEVDQEAYARGNSCYLGDGVYPMIPENLSNVICSLEPNKERRALCLIGEVDRSGLLISETFVEAVIKSKHKLSYEKAEKIHLGELSGYEDVKTSIDDAYELSEILTEMRRERGAITLNLVQPTFILDETKTKVVDVVDKTQISSTKIIESLMILYNEAVGELLQDCKGTMFRSHEKPSLIKIRALKETCDNLEKDFKCDFSNQNLQEFLESLKGDENEEFLNFALLKSMAKAKYTKELLPHYALASNKYVHSTSPIRRYSDLIAHRKIKQVIKINTNLQTDTRFDEEVEKQLCLRESLAEKASRETQKLMFSIWAEEHVGESFKGKILSLTRHGALVKLDNNFINVFVDYRDIFKNYKKVFVNETETMAQNKTDKESVMVGDVFSITINLADRNTKTVEGRFDEMVGEKRECLVNLFEENYKNEKESVSGFFKENIKPIEADGYAPRSTRKQRKEEFYKKIKEKKETEKIAKCQESFEKEKTKKRKEEPEKVVERRIITAKEAYDMKQQRQKENREKRKKAKQKNAGVKEQGKTAVSCKNSNKVREISKKKRKGNEQEKGLKATDQQDRNL